MLVLLPVQVVRQIAVNSDMALKNAISFLHRFVNDGEFRHSCNELTKNELLSIHRFNEHEFNDALNMRLVKCQTHEEAEEIQEVKLWFMIM